MYFINMTNVFSLMQTTMPSDLSAIYVCIYYNFKVTAFMILV